MWISKKKLKRVCMEVMLSQTKRIFLFYEVTRRCDDVLNKYREIIRTDGINETYIEQCHDEINMELRALEELYDVEMKCEFVMGNLTERIHQRYVEEIHYYVREKNGKNWTPMHEWVFGKTR